MTIKAHPPHANATPVATVSSQMFDAILDAAESAGVLDSRGVEALRRRLRLVAGPAPTRFSDRALLAVWDAIVAASGADHAVGARLSLHASTNVFGAFGEATLKGSTSPIDAYERVARYSRLAHQGVTISVTVDGRFLSLACAKAGSSFGMTRDGEAAGQVWAMANLAMIPARFFDLDVKPLTAELTCERPADLSDLHRVFGRSLICEAPQAKLVFDRRALEQARRPAENLLLRALDEFADRALEAVPPVEDVAGLVAAELRGRLVGGPPDLDAVARSIGLSSRTLQRRLSEAGTSFAGVLDEVRRERARALLAGPHVAMAEIAYLLGYAEQAVFTRAAKRWFGTAPSRARNVA